MRPSKLILFTLAVINIHVEQAAAQSESTKQFLWKQCNEYALALRVDPGPIRDVVGSDFSLLLEEDKALVAIIVQDCSQYWLDGKDLGPTQHTHVWVSVDAPQDIRPIAGAHQTMPTRTWFNLFAGSTNPNGRTARKASGTSPGPIEGVHLDPPPTPGGGRVTVGPGLSYSWSVPPSDHSPRPMGFNHDVYLRDSAGNTVLKRISAIGNMVGEPTPGTLEIVGGADPGGLVGTGKYPVRVFTLFPVWARVTLGEDVSQ